MEYLALKCDLRDDRTVRERLARYGRHSVQYEEGLAVARSIRASRYLGAFRLSHSRTVLTTHFDLSPFSFTSECSSKHNRGVSEVFHEAARVSLSTRPKGSGDRCVVM